LQNINNIKKRFLALNHDRLMRTRDSLRTRQRDILDILPLLFHSNHPTFPGFVSKSTPLGISDYSPAQRTLAAGKRIVRSFQYQKRALLQYDILSLFLMGSSGTIAYSSKSDFDIWVCYRPELSTMQLAELQQKASLIELWAESMDLEVHFFLMNADSFKEGQEVELSVESSGSAQHHLLLEEFYRTGLLLAGRYPIWWLVPPEQEKHYEKYIRRLKEKRFIKSNEAIDFGGLPEAPAEEFFGAALWQLYKSIDSPYKATLKLMLMEVYAHEYPRVDLLSQRFKKAIHEGVNELASLDPYIMLYRKLEEYLRRQDQDEHRLELVRRCFYYKVNEQLSHQSGNRHESWRRELMRAFTRDWNWDDDYLQLLDSRSSWKINQVFEERDTLVSTLTQSYHSLSDFARQHSQSAKINQHDLTILGRKLYAAFDRKPGKIDLINRGISDNVRENRLSIHQTGKARNTGWALYHGITNGVSDSSNKVLKRSTTLIGLLSWCFLNQIADERTAIVLYTRDNSVTANEVKSVIKCLVQLFPGARLEPSRLEDFTRTTQLKKSALFINIGLSPLTEGVREGKFLTSNKIDAFSYGGICQNLVLSIDHIMQTSWQEVLAYRYENEEGIFDCLNAYLQWSPPSSGEPPPPLQAFCFSTGRGATIARRVEDLFNDIVHCFYHAAHGASSRYVLMIEHKYYLLQLDHDNLLYEVAGAYHDLLKLLAQPQQSFSPVYIDRYADANNLLAVMYQNNQPGIIQLYFQLDGTTTDIYIIDERGSLFFQHKVRANIKLIICQYTHFLTAVAQQQAATMARDRDSRLEFYQAKKASDGTWQLAPQEAPDTTSEEKCFNIRVIGNNSDGSLVIYCDGKEFSKREHGEQLFWAVAVHVLEKRKSGACYPIFITEIDLPSGILGAISPEQLQSSHYLNYKKYIEDQLNAALVAQVEAFRRKVS